MNSKAAPLERKVILKRWRHLHKRMDILMDAFERRETDPLIKDLVDLVHDCVYWIMLEEVNRVCLSGKVGPSKASLFL